MPAKKPDLSYPGDDAVRRVLVRYRCPTPFHVVRMRLWGEIVRPSLGASPVKTIVSLWPDGMPIFTNADEANGFFQALMSLWNRMAKFQGGSPPLKLQKVGHIDTREALREAANLRAEELRDGFMKGFTGGNRHIDVPPGVSDLLIRVEKGIELLATARNTLARPPGPDDDAILAELTKVFPVVDRATQSDLNAIAIACKEWRKTEVQAMRDTAQKGAPN